MPLTLNQKEHLIIKQQRTRMNEILKEKQELKEAIKNCFKKIEAYREKLNSLDEEFSTLVANAIPDQIIKLKKKTPHKKAPLEKSSPESFLKKIEEKIKNDPKVVAKLAELGILEQEI